MIGGRNKQRIKVNRVDPKLRQIIHLLKDSRKVASVKFPDPHGGGILAPILNPYRLIADILVFVCQNVIFRVPVKEPVDVNLIENRSLGPLRRRKARPDLEKEIHIYLIHRAPHIIAALYISDYNLKIIQNRLVFQLQLILIVIKAADALDLIH